MPKPQQVAAPYTHIFIILLENVGYNPVIGNTTDAPYINNVLLPQGRLYTESFGVAHPSLPNYLALFAGSTLGGTNDHCTLASPPNGPFNAPNLYTRLTDAGYSILGYMESMPSNGFLGCSGGGYGQRHNPFAFFQTNQPGSNVPPSAWVIYKGPYSPTASWPNFTFITPNTKDDMHDGATLSIKVSNGDTWLSKHLPPIITFANNNNGLVILTMDEGKSAGTANHIPTILVGVGIAPGTVNTTLVNHYNTIKTITDNFGVAPLGNSTGLPGL